jgi:mono/diheme cytochrome c family protein
MLAAGLLGLLACLGAGAWAGESRGVVPTPAASVPRVEAVPAGTLRQQIEDDWLRAIAEPLSTRSDAVGAVDGIKDGKYAFHTGFAPNPWWQVDLGKPTPIGRIVVYNRLDYAPGLHNADNLRILTSDDGQSWTLRHDNGGQHFGGIHGAKPLEVSFPVDQRSARFVRLQLPSPQPIFFHLDEVEIYGPEPDGQNLALHRPADQSSLSQWSTAKSRGAFFPTADCLDRARRLATDLRHAGLDVEPYLVELDAAARRLDALPADAGEQAQRELYLQTRWLVRRLVLANPLLDFDRLLFVKRFTQETYPDICLNHMPWVSRPGGDICVLEKPADGTTLFAALAGPPGDLPEQPVANVRYVLNGALGPGHVHGIDLWFDGDRVVFGYAKAKSDQPPAGWLDRRESFRLRREEEPIQIFEVGVDGQRLRQITEGEWSDLDPTYLPNGDIAFVSERCGTSLQCNEYDKDETSCNLYVMRSDGSQIRRLSVNKDGDYLPHCLDNGLIGYTRWEYHERSWAYIQSLWVVRPDGTGADAIFKQHFVDPWALEDVRSIPHSNKLVAIAAGHHTLAVGPLVVIDTSVGINEPRGIGIVTPNVKPPEGGMAGVPVPQGGVCDPGGYYGTPWALSEKFFLVNYTYGTSTTVPNGYGLYLVDVFGNKELIYRDPDISCWFPIPLRARPTPPVLADVTEPGLDDAVCAVSDIAYGCDGIDPAQVRYLRIAEPIGWPYDNTYGGHRYGEDHRYGGPGAERRNLTNWTPVRILGDVPVEPDGSAHFRVPADTAVYFQLLDENRMELRRMRSFISFQPGEMRACVGCHETRGVAPLEKLSADSLALAREPSLPMPPPWGDRPVSFLRDIQPVLDRHCVGCHSGLKPAGEIDLGGGLISYDREVADYGHNRAFETILEKQLVSISAARAQDASITPPLAYGSHRSKLLAALADEHHAGEVVLDAEERLRLAMWIDANAPYHDRFVNKRAERTVYDLPGDPELVKRLTAVHTQRCAACHAPADVTRTDWIDIRRPDRSLFLTAPLARPAGGDGKCAGPVYRDTTDPEYQAVRALVQSAVDQLWEHPRRDVTSLDRLP